MRPRGKRVVLAEAMTIFHMPLYRKLEELQQGGKLGPLRLIQMNFGSYKEYDMKNRFFNRNLAGGALLDIGVYALSFARWFLSSQPDQVLSQVRFAPTGVDEQAGILLMNPQQEMVTVSLSLHAKQPKRGMVAFDQGYLEVYEYPRADQAVLPTPRTAIGKPSRPAAPKTLWCMKSRIWSTPLPPARTGCTWITPKTSWSL